jgi:hypothetical protein
VDQVIRGWRFRIDSPVTEADIHPPTTMSRLKRKYGLRRSRYRGYDAVATGIGLGIFVYHAGPCGRRAKVLARLKASRPYDHR